MQKSISTFLDAQHVQRLHQVSLTARQLQADMKATIFQFTICYNQSMQKSVFASDLETGGLQQQKTALNVTLVS